MSDLSTVGILVIIAVIGASTQYIAGAIARKIAARRNRKDVRNNG